MTMRPGSFRPDELVGADVDFEDAEVARVAAAAEVIERSTPSDSLQPTVDFTGRVMAALASEPTPRRAGWLRGAAERLGLGRLVASVGGAWAIFVDASGRPAGVRAAALTYVLVVLLAAASLTGVAALGVGGALQFLSRDASPTPSLLVEPTTPPDLGPVVEPSFSPSPSESVEPDASGGPDDSLEPGETGPSTAPGGSTTGSTASPGASAEGSDDHGGASPSPSDDHGGSGSPSGLPEPSKTPRPSETPH
ncbi:MAG: hypothetical protein ABIQ17_06470 [Candidatus Limnocylindrales bacterium]